MAASAPYGSWRSPISAEALAAGAVTLTQVAFARGVIYWIEGRPDEAGRNVIVCRDSGGAVRDVLPPPYNARTRVHEYGGGAYAVSNDGIVYFSNFADQRLYRLAPGAAPVPITPDGARRYADIVIDERRRRLLCVMEDHSAGGMPVNSIVAVEIAGSHAPRVLVEGDDFYAAPRLDPDGRRLAWLAWNQPDMPWDATALHLAGLAPDGAPAGAVCVAGGADESVCQPSFAPDGALYYVSDASGWWNLYRWRDGAGQALAPSAAEFGVPHWVFAQSAYAFAGRDRILAAHNVAGVWRLMLIDTTSGAQRILQTPYTDIGYVQASPERGVFIGAAPTQLPAVIEIDLARGRTASVRATASLCVDPGYLSRAQPIAYDTAAGERAHAFFYPPHNHDVVPPGNATPPLLVCAHGGPTSATSSALNLKLQYWTSRGFAVLDVNYRGSTGYGRTYRNRLRRGWGVVDVEDCVRGARCLVEEQRADPARIAIRGASAGGYTALCAAAFQKFFRAAASYYGVSDLEALVRDTHKFEARYLDRLIGPYPESRALYRQRSPLAHVDGIECPVIFFQGSEDRVVPPDQTERMVEALRAKGMAVAYLAFAGEQHGFRQAANIKRALEAELYFYGRLFGVAPADALHPISISNFDTR